MSSIGGKKVLVTGADGFIGSHVVEALIAASADVRAFVFYNAFNSWGWLDRLDADVRKEFEVFVGDVRDPYGVRKAVDGCDVVLHLAALIGIPYSYHSPQTYVETNIGGTLNVVQAARDLSVEKVVHTSTSEVYGSAQYVPIGEDHPLNAQSPYAATKIGADQMAMSFYASFSTPVATIRPFNTYGPRQSARAVIPTVITQIANGERRLRLGSLHPTRDFNYVKDTARAFLAVAESEGTVGEVVNIGSNFEISVGEVADIITDVMQAKVEIESDDQRVRPARSEVERLWADNAKAERLTGWRPEYAGREGFRRGIEETVAWFRDPANIQAYKSDIYNI